MELNIRKVFKDKAPGIARFIPGFIYKYIERTIHQDEMNEMLRIYGHHHGIDFASDCIDYFNIKIAITGLDNIDNNGKYLFISNHPIGGLDGIVLISVIGKKFGGVKVVVNDILMNIENLKPTFLPVNKHGSQSKENAEIIDAAFASNIPIVTFPAGLCSRRINKEIIDLEWRKNFISKAISSQRDIIPIYFDAKNSNFFYKLANLRKRLGIKANIEMFYLADETFRHRNGSFKITFGKPISYTRLDNSRTHKEWAETIKKLTYSLKDNPNAGL